MEESDKYSRQRNTPSNKKTYHAGLPTIEGDDESDEKPWQKVPSIALLYLLGGYLIFGCLAQLIEEDMPRPIGESQIQKHDWQTFSEESARSYLDQLLGDGPRVAGTKYHLVKAEDLIELIESITAKASLPIRFDWQQASDVFWQDFSTPYASSYFNVSNLIAVLEGKSGFDSEQNIGSSILVNCHYDSVPFAIGASDNGVFCAVMLEALHRLSRRKEKFRHNIVFLFNGAEENGLQGSQGFLQHPWSTGVVGVVNLDAAGMNGKPAVFQVTDARILEAYKQTARRPNAQSVGEALFNSGMIPSHTDFSIWTHFGHFRGIDTAFAKWCDVYHTRNDKPQLIKDGVLQNAGEMLLELLWKLADDPQMDQKAPETSMVYYDYLNIFLVTYSTTTAIFVDVSVSLFALLTVAYYLSTVGFRGSSVMGLASAAFIRVLGLLGGCLMCILAILCMALVADQLRYLARPWIVVPFYWIPNLLGGLIITIGHEELEGQGGLSRSLRTLEAMAATRSLLAIFLLVLAFVPSLASLRYVLVLPLAFMSVASLISITAVRLFRIKAWQQLTLEFVLSVPAFLFVATLALRLNAIMIPTTGRMPVNMPDYTVGAINMAMATLAASTVSGIELLFSRKRLWLPLGLVSTICVVLMVTPFTIYQDDGVAIQRQYWFHSEIISYDFKGAEVYRESGILIPRIDAYTLKTVKQVYADAKWKDDIKSDCEKYVYCNLPLMRPKFAKMVNDSLFAYTSPPDMFRPAPSLNATRVCNGEECTLYVEMIGTAHNMLTILPLNGELSRWSLSVPLKPTSTFAGKPLYMISHLVLMYSDELPPFNFQLTFKTKSTSSQQPLVEISHHAHKIFQPEDFTKEYKKFLAKKPQYFDVASTISIRTNYVF